VTRINEKHRIIVKQVVYDKIMKQIRTVRHSFNTTDTANYKAQLAVPPSTKIAIIIIIMLFSKKKLTNKYTKKLGIFNLSRDHSRTKKSMEINWSSAQH